MLILCPTLFEARSIFGEQIDTWSESSSYFSVASKVALAITGFGLAGSGVGAAFAISEYKSRNKCLPTQVILVGLAGSFELSLAAIGEVIQSSIAYCHGIGRLANEGLISSAQLAWPQGLKLEQQPDIFDQIDLEAVYDLKSAPILSVAAASGSSEIASERKSLYKDLLLEDMESFAVALACRLFALNLTVIRAVSNRVGDRKENWNLELPFKNLSNFITKQVLN